MNKTILIAGGASVASLVVGGAAGYFYSKRRWQDHFLKELEHELESARKVFAVRLMQAKDGKPESPADIPITTDENDEPDDDTILAQNAGMAVKNYQSYAGDVTTESSIQHKNIFSSTATPAKKLPPRGDGGKFIPRIVQPDPNADDNQPYIISDEDFLENKTDYFQVYLLYFVKEDTLVKAHETGETLDNAVVGQTNLEKFPKVMKGEERRLFVRNDQLEEDYEILMMHEPLTEYIGLQES